MNYDQKQSSKKYFADKETETKKEPNKKEVVTPSKFTANQNSFSALDSEAQNSENQKEELKFFGVSEYYINEISQELISKYGNYFIKNFGPKNLDVPPTDFMANHKINPSIRSKMVNWMLEVFHSFGSSEETIFSAVKIMDKYLWKAKDKLKNEDVHLIGMVSMYLASKTYDVTPIQMNNLIHLVGHNIFDQKTIKEMEKKIIKAIDFDVFCPTTYEFIQFILYDFYMNNKKAIIGLKLKKMLEILENCSIFLAKMCNHFDNYSSVSPIYLSLTCVIIGYDMMKDNCRALTEEKQKFFKDWLQFLYSNIAKTQDIKNDLEKIYKNIENTYSEFNKMKLPNLVKYHDLYFD